MHLAWAIAVTDVTTTVGEYIVFCVAQSLDLLRPTPENPHPPHLPKVRSPKPPFHHALRTTPSHRSHPHVVFHCLGFSLCLALSFMTIVWFDCSYVLSDEWSWWCICSCVDLPTCWSECYLQAGLMCVRFSANVCCSDVLAVFILCAGESVERWVTCSLRLFWVCQRIELWCVCRFHTSILIEYFNFRLLISM